MNKMGLNLKNLNSLQISKTHYFEILNKALVATESYFKNSGKNLDEVDSDHATVLLSYYVGRFLIINKKPKLLLEWDEIFQISVDVLDKERGTIQ